MGAQLIGQDSEQTIPGPHSVAALATQEQVDGPVDVSMALTVPSWPKKPMPPTTTGSTLEFWTFVGKGVLQRTWPVVLTLTAHT